MTHREAVQAEAILREYLLRTCDRVTFQVRGSSSMALFTFIPHPFRYTRLLKKIVDADVSSRDDDYWVFNLTENVKQLINQATLMLNGSGSVFSGFVDPKFTRDGNEIGYFIINDRILNLFISDIDKMHLADQGIYMDNPEM